MGLTSTVITLCGLGLAWAGPAAPQAAAGPQVIAVPMNVSGTVPPVCTLPLGPGGTPCADAGAPVVLSALQVSVLESLLAAPATWGGDEGKCSLPLHGFAWLRADGTIDRQIAVSLLCDKVEGAAAVPGQPADEASRGLSGDGKLALRALCADLGLPRCHITRPEEAFAL